MPVLIQKCMKKRWHKGYGHTLILRVKDKEAFMARCREYKLAYEKFGEKLQSSNFDTSKDIFLFYAHLDKILVEKGDLVKAGDKIATSGASGVTSGTPAPHLHFEIFTTRYAIGEGLNFRCNPGLYVYFRNIYQMSDAEKILQKETAKNVINNPSQLNRTKRSHMINKFSYYFIHFFADLFASLRKNWIKE